MIIIAIANQKGGVGKTTTAIHLAHWFARQGKRVLLVDTDLQGHSGLALGVDPASSFFAWMSADQDVCDAAIEARDNLHLIRSDKKTERATMFFSAASVPERYTFLAKKLATGDGIYDLVFLDLAPSANLLHEAALVASDLFLVPSRMNMLGLAGVMEILSTARGLDKLADCLNT